MDNLLDIRQDSMERLQEYSCKHKVCMSSVIERAIDEYLDKRYLAFTIATKGYLCRDEMVLSNKSGHMMCGINSKSRGSVIAGTLSFSVCQIEGEQQCIIEEITVLDNYRREGCGSSLLNFLKVYAQKHNASCIRITIDDAIRAVYNDDNASTNVSPSTFHEFLVKNGFVEDSDDLLGNSYVFWFT